MVLRYAMLDAAARCGRPTEVSMNATSPDVRLGCLRPGCLSCRIEKNSVATPLRSPRFLNGVDARADFAMGKSG
jgi:hypothetical protein